MNRRSFFQSLYKGAAIVALAPQIAFRTPKPKFFEGTIDEFQIWTRVLTDEEKCSLTKGMVSYFTLEDFQELRRREEARSAI